MNQNVHQLMDGWEKMCCICLMVYHTTVHNKWFYENFRLMNEIGKKKNYKEWGHPNPERHAGCSFLHLHTTFKPFVLYV